MSGPGRRRRRDGEPGARWLACTTRSLPGWGSCSVRRRCCNRGGADLRPEVAEALRGATGCQRPPGSGVREEPTIWRLLLGCSSRRGTETRRLSEKDFDDTVADSMMRRRRWGHQQRAQPLSSPTAMPPRCASSSANSRIRSTANGLLIVQRFPAPHAAEDGGRPALDFNRADLAETPAGWRVRQPRLHRRDDLLQRFHPLTPC